MNKKKKDVLTIYNGLASTSSSSSKSLFLNQHNRKLHFFIRETISIHNSMLFHIPNRIVIIQPVLRLRNVQNRERKRFIHLISILKEVNTILGSRLSEPTLAGRSHTRKERKRTNNGVDATVTSILTRAKIPLLETRRERGKNRRKSGIESGIISMLFRIESGISGLVSEETISITSDMEYIVFSSNNLLIIEKWNNIHEGR